MAALVSLTIRDALSTGRVPQGSISFTRDVLNSTTNTTAGLLADLAFAEVKPMRTSTIILAAFNILAALFIASSILYDCYWASKRASPEYKAEKFCVSKIHPAETFPLVLSLGIAIQGGVFIFAQSTGLNSLLSDQCTLVAQLVFPALFLVPYIQLVFGLECAIRSLRRMPFQPRGKYDVTVCLVVILLLTIGTWIPAALHPTKAVCYGSLIFFTANNTLHSLIIFSVFGVLVAISALTIYYKLSRTSVIEPNQRIAASRMVYYLVTALVSLAFIFPWNVTMVMHKPTMISTMMANVVLNLSGLILGIVQLVLRANTVSTSFGTGDDATWRRKHHAIRFWGPNELGINNDGHKPDPARSESRMGLTTSEKPTTDDYLQSPPLVMPRLVPAALKPKTLKPLAEPESEAVEATVQLPATPDRQPSKRTYSLFPTGKVSTTPFRTPGPLPARLAGPPRPTTNLTFLDSDSSKEAVPALQNIKDLGPPPRFGPAGISSHRRESSAMSSATVQIGLRLSHAPGAGQLVRGSTERGAVASTRTLPPQRSGQLVVVPGTVPRLGLLQTGISSPPLPPLPTSVSSTPSRMKTLPPTPRPADSPRRAVIPDVDTETRLSPAVYTPSVTSTSNAKASPSKITSPRSREGAAPKADQRSPPAHGHTPTSAKQVQFAVVKNAAGEWI